MLRRIIRQFPLLRPHNTPLSYLFSNSQNQPKQQRPKQLKSSQFEKTIMKYAIKLQTATKQVKDSGVELSSRFKIFTHFTQLAKKRGVRQEELANTGKEQTAKNTAQTKSNATKEEKTKGQSDEQKPQQNNQIKASMRMLAIALGVAFFLLFANSNDQGLPYSQQIISSSKIINQTEMINMLSAGLMNSDIVIVREFKNKSGQHSRSTYQTICIAKEVTKIGAPKICIINNLAHFLSKIQNISLPYSVSFVYSADEPKQPLQFPLGQIIMVGLLYLGYRVLKKGGLGGSGFNNQLRNQLNLKKYEPIKPDQIKTNFKDVAGMHEAKQQITEFVDFLKNPDKYIEMGAKIPKGALLTGPPGTGKTLLARACAGEAGVPFFYVSGSEFVEKYVGLGANRVRSLFQAAAKAAPSIIFIDEIDAIGKKRNSGPFSNEQKENTLNQLLVNMDGFDSKNKIIVMAATNLKDSLDPALLRPGRFDRAVEINLPNFQERIEILKVHLSKVTFSKKFTIEELAKKISVLTPGFSGAELANICNEAAILAARDSKKAIELPQFEKATQRVMAGLQKRNLFSEEEKECLAYYECGKAVASWFTQGADPIIKISIAPYSKSSTGYSHQIKDEMPLKTRSELLNKAVCFLAGRMAELHFKGYTTNNGDRQLKKAKRIVTVMVSKFGMSNVIGRIGYPDIQYVRKPYSDQVQSKIDEEVTKLFDQCLKRAKELVGQKAELIQTLKKLILEKETLTHNALKEILGERPFEDNENYQKFLKDGKEESKEQEVTLTPPAPQ